jgi:hypothetical protein
LRALLELKDENEHALEKTMGHGGFLTWMSCGKKFSLMCILKEKIWLMAGWDGTNTNFSPMCG